MERTEESVSTPAAFESFCERIGLSLEDFQRRIVKEVDTSRRELLVLLPRGNGKTTLMAALALHHILTVGRPAVYLAAASRDQARVLYEAARGFAERLPEGEVTLRHLELRVPGGHLRVVASDAPKVHGLTPSLAIIDELHAHRDAELYLALRTALLKRPDSRLVTISTAGYGEDSPLSRLRARALGQPSVERTGALTVAHGPSLGMLEWAVPDDADIEDPAVGKAANPASWITEEGLGEQREAVHELAFRRYHANQWTVAEHHWLPPGAWQACAGEVDISPGERVWVGVDIGGERSASAVVWVNGALPRRLRGLSGRRGRAHGRREGPRAGRDLRGGRGRA